MITSLLPWGMTGHPTNRDNDVVSNEKIITWVLTALISAVTSTGAFALQIGEFKQKQVQTTRDTQKLEVRMNNLESIMTEIRIDRTDLHADVQHVKETLDDIKKGVYALGKGK